MDLWVYNDSNRQGRNLAFGGLDSGRHFGYELTMGDFPLNKFGSPLNLDSDFLVLWILVVWTGRSPSLKVSNGLPAVRVGTGICVHVTACHDLPRPLSCSRFWKLEGLDESRISRWSLKVLNAMFMCFARNRDPWSPMYGNRKYQIGRTVAGF